jgi:hypothetical protein
LSGKAAGREADHSAFPGIGEIAASKNCRACRGSEREPLRNKKEGPSRIFVIYRVGCGNPTSRDGAIHHQRQQALPHPDIRAASERPTTDRAPPRPPPSHPTKPLAGSSVPVQSRDLVSSRPLLNASLRRLVSVRQPLPHQLAKSRLANYSALPGPLVPH